MPTTRGRNLDDLLRTLGSDQTQEQPLIDAKDIDLAYQVGDLSFSVGARSSAKVMMHLIPSSLAAQFSGFDLTPRLGMWVRKLVVPAGTANCIVQIVPGVSFSAMAVNDALTGFPVILGLPESSEFNQQTNVSLNQVTTPTAGFPQIFAAAQVGRFAAGQTGVFYPAGVEPLVDLWIPPMNTLEVSATTAAAVISVQLQLEITAEYLFTGQS
jgi:hypothetical protein